MPDYKKMYLKLVRATEEAINVLVAAQRECEEMYLSTPESNITVLSPPDAKKRQLH